MSLRQSMRVQCSVILAILGVASACQTPGDGIGTSELLIYGTTTSGGAGVPGLEVRVVRGPPNCPILDPSTPFVAGITDADGKYRVHLVTLFTEGTVVCWRAVVMFTNGSQPDSVVHPNTLFPTQSSKSPQDSLRIDFALP